ncbi:MAG: sigma-70 family RNA polymerase sigma factor [Lentisphaeria bacterium]|nr:sigma-70 family RNA polymerase sigma factor [Lentisphaeria bacterium]
MGSEEERKPEVEALIEENLRLVLKIANDFLGRGLPWDDLVSEGNRGLVIAAERYDPSRGAKFSTYSACWIKQAIHQAIAEQALTVRVPMGTQINARKIRKTVKSLTNSLGRTPTDEEVAEASALPLVTVERLRDNRQVDMSSLNSPVDEAVPEGMDFIEFVTDESFPAPDQELVKIEDIEQLLKLLNSLSERERKVISMRFGLNGEPVRTLEQVGKELDCTNERVRQIQNIALKKLHNRMVRLK